MKTEKNEEAASSEEGQGIAKGIGTFVWDIAKVFLIAFVLVWLVLRPFIAEPFIVSGSSMVPNFHDQEYLVIEKISYHTHEPMRGDVVVFKYPKDPKQFFIKRVVGLPGEKVQVINGGVTIFNSQNPEGLVLDEQYLPNQHITLGTSEIVTLGKDEYFVMGDNRTQSSDSRMWGPMPKSDLVGRAWFRVLPLGNAGLVTH
jgi:signal peptidase I